MEESYLVDTDVEDDAGTADRLEKLRAELADKSEELAALNAKWEAEKAGRNRRGHLRVKLDELHTGAQASRAREPLRGCRAYPERGHSTG